MKFRLAIASTLMLIAVSLNLGAQIDPNQAISELSNLQESLNQSDINERTIKQTREKGKLKPNRNLYTFLQRPLQLQLMR